MPSRKSRIEKEPESDGSTDKDGDGDSFHRSASSDNCIKQRAVMVKNPRYNIEENGSQAVNPSNRSIEIFFGKLTNFGSFYQSLADKGYKTPRVESDQEEPRLTNPDPTKTTVNPCAVKKLCLVGHPLTSFKGLNGFKKLSEAWVTNCSIEVCIFDLLSITFFCLVESILNV